MDGKTYAALYVTEFAVTENSYRVKLKDASDETFYANFHKDTLNEVMLTKLLHTEPNTINGRTDLNIEMTGIMDARYGNTAESMLIGFMDDGIEYSVFRTLSFF